MSELTRIPAPERVAPASQYTQVRAGFRADGAEEAFEAGGARCPWCGM